VVAAMQAQLAVDTGVVGRFLCRADDDATCMEIYHLTADAPIFERALARAFFDLVIVAQVTHWFENEWADSVGRTCSHVMS